MTTLTAVGEIPHLALRTGCGLPFDAPVKVVIGPENTRPHGPVELAFPRMRKGCLVYALPGGGEIVKEQT